jgi:hypothetical protein
VPSRLCGTKGSTTTNRQHAQQIRPAGCRASEAYAPPSCCGILSARLQRSDGYANRCPNWRGPLSPDAGVERSCDSSRAHDPKVADRNRTSASLFRAPEEPENVHGVQHSVL